MDATTADSALDWPTTTNLEQGSGIAPVSGIAPGRDIDLAIERDAAAIITAATGSPAATGLTPRQQAILDFERQWWRQPGAKEQAIRESFDLSPTRYYQALNDLLALPQALAYDPGLVQRLVRLRTSGPAARRRLD